MKVRNGNDSSISASCTRGLVAVSLMAALAAGGLATAPLPAFAATSAKQAAADNAARAKRDAIRKAKAGKQAAADKAARAKRAARARKQAAADKAARAKRAAKARDKALAAALARAGAWSKAKVSWYGPGFYGHGMAGGGILRQNSMVVAHRTLPFGTLVQFSYGGKKVVAVVQDRGPFIAGRVFDLGPGTSAAIGFQRVGVGVVQYRILH